MCCRVAARNSCRICTNEECTRTHTHCKLHYVGNAPGDDSGGAGGKPVAADHRVGVVVHHVDVVAAVGREGLPLDGDHPRAGKDCVRRRSNDLGYPFDFP